MSDSDQLPPELSHIDAEGAAHMVDVGHKPDTVREAIAEGQISMNATAFQAITDGRIQKGEVFSVARLAGIMAAKKTADLIPLCHPLPLSYIHIAFSVDASQHVINIQATIRTTGKTGVEMEALTAVSVATLTIYDMAKALDRAMQIGEIRLLEKSGGRSGTYRAEE